MTIPTRKLNRQPRQEHSVPWFWPFAAAIELGEEGMKIFQDNLRYVATTEEMAAPPEPEWATPNRILLEMDTMRLRDFSLAGHKCAQTPVLIDAPYAGHHSTIADYAKGHRNANGGWSRTSAGDGLEECHRLDEGL